MEKSAKRTNVTFEDFLCIAIPQCITYVQEYPYIGLLLISLSEACILTIFDQLLSSMNIDIPNAIDFEVVHQIVLDRSVYKDFEAADDLIYEGFPPKFPINDEAPYFLYQAYSCVGKNIEEVDSWIFFKSYFLIHISDWSAEYKDVITRLYSLDRNLKNEEYKLIGQEFIETILKL